MYMYINGIMGLIALCVFPILLFSRPDLSDFTQFIAIFNMVCFYAYYQFGATYMHSIPISFTMFILTIPVAFYDGMTSVYALLMPPDFKTFETIKKV
jgi:hypothetical protein